MRLAAAALTLLLASCATSVAAPSQNSVCRTPMPLELRLRRMEERIALAYQHGPQLSADEHERMRRHQACHAVGGDCATDWEGAASDLGRRYAIGAARYDIPSLTRPAAAALLGAERTNLLVVAMLSAEAAARALEGYQPIATSDDVIAMNLVSADLHQAIVCESADLAAGRRAGLTYDPTAAVPAGP